MSTNMATTMTTTVVILAAGKGTRMHSNVAKPLQHIAGIPLIEHIIAAVQTLDTAQILVVVGTEHQQFLYLCAHHPNIKLCVQAELLGTGHALQVALEHVTDGNTVLVLNGDMPLLSAATMQQMIQGSDDALAILTSHVDDATGYGRVIRDDAHLIAEVVEEKDANMLQRNIREINCGAYAASKALFKKLVHQLTNTNSQQEFYITQCIRLALQENCIVCGIHSANDWEVLGINDRADQANLERHYQLHQANEMMRKGLHLVDPQRFDLRGQLTHGSDTRIDVNVIIEGRVTLGNNVLIGSGCMLRNCHIADGATIKPYSLIDGAQIGMAASIGPFARIRPSSKIAEHAKIGNFVETKNAVIGAKSKVNHLSYIGDCNIGDGCNIGAGTITCNYDGNNKHITQLGNGVFVGSNTTLVAPVKLDDNAFIAAATTVTDDVPKNNFAHARIAQRNALRRSIAKHRK